MPCIYCSFSGRDMDVARPIAEALTALGFTVRFSPQVEGPSLSSKAIARELEGASCVLALWSSNSVDLAWVRREAEAGRAHGGLVQARLDDASPPVDPGELIDVSDWAAAPSAELPPSLLRAIRAHANRPVRRADGRRRARRGRAGRRLVLAGLASAVVLAGLGLWRLQTETTAAAAWRDVPGRLPETLSSVGLFLRGLGPEDGADVRGREQTPLITAAEAWADTDRGDVVALRRFLAAHPDGPTADAATAALDALEAAAWDRVRAPAGAGETLAAIAAYRDAFPEGRHAAEAAGIERAQRQAVATAQSFLSAAGLDPGPVDGAPRPATVSAVRAFESSIGKAPSGEIDAALLAALAVAGASDAAIDAPAEALTRAPPNRSARAAARSIARDTSALAWDAPDAPVDVAFAAPRAPTEEGPAGAMRSGSAAGATGAAAAAPAPFRDCYVCPEMVVVPAGAFRMGDLAGVGDRVERPIRTVEIAVPFAVGRFEVTFEEWDACIAEGGCVHRPDDQGWGRGAQPVVNVSWSDTAEYIAWLNAKTGERYRLLSEAEWEYAARAGATTPYPSGAAFADLCRTANGADASSAYEWRNTTCTDGFDAGPAPVGRFAPNAFGLHDMIGNVWEWTADCWHDSYRGAPVDGSAWELACDRRDQVLRGGAWSVDPHTLRAAHRYAFADERTPFFGFRVAREVTP